MGYFVLCLRNGLNVSIVFPFTYVLVLARQYISVLGLVNGGGHVVCWGSILYLDFCYVF